jgi:hypothetical protein
MHLVNIIGIITFSFLVGHSILTIRDFNSFRVFWDTLYMHEFLTDDARVLLYIYATASVNYFDTTVSTSKLLCAKWLFSFVGDEKILYQLNLMK